jgi:hypothetical protein
MSRGRQNKLVGQVAEHLVVAELGRRGLIATGFAGNVPAFDVIAADEMCRTVPIQVKASSGDSWPSDARVFLRLEYDRKEKRQNYLGPTELTNPDLIYVYVALADEAADTDDRFFVLTMRELQEVCIRCYTSWMESKDWKRPRNPESYDNRFWIKDIAAYENRWSLVLDRLDSRPPDPVRGTG